MTTYIAEAEPLNKHEIAHEVAWLAGTDHPQNIANRLGLSCSKVASVLYDLGMAELARPFAVLDNSHQRRQMALKRAAVRESQD